jgi:GxxExxY protein
MDTSGREPISVELDRIASITVTSIFEVHKTLGPGLLESVYAYCLIHELRSRGLHVEAQVPLPIYYKDVRLDAGLRLDLLVEHELIVELKAIESIGDVHMAQLLTYLKLSNKRLGFLVNFNVPLIKQGIKRVAL